MAPRMWPPRSSSRGHMVPRECKNTFYQLVYDSHVTCRLTAKNRDQLRNPTLGNRVWATFFTFVTNVVSDNNLRWRMYTAWEKNHRNPIVLKLCKGITATLQPFQVHQIAKPTHVSRHPQLGIDGWSNVLQTTACMPFIATSTAGLGTVHRSSPQHLCSNYPRKVWLSIWAGYPANFGSMPA